MHDGFLVDWDDDLRSRRSVAQGAVRPDGVVVDAPPFDEDLRLAEREEDLGVQQLVAEAGVEALDIAVLPRRSRLDVGRLGTDSCDPGPDVLGNELGAIIAADKGRGPCSMNRSVRASITSVEFSFRFTRMVPLPGRRFGNAKSAEGDTLD